MGQFAPGLIQQTLKCNSLFGQAALQRPSAQVQLSREVLYPRTLTRQ